MRKSISITAYGATALLAAYVSYDVAADFGATYHLGKVLSVAGGVALFSTLTGGFWATITHAIESFKMGRQYSWPVTVARVLGFIVGMVAGSAGFAGAMYDYLPGWQIGLALLMGFVGMMVFGFATVFAAPIGLEPAEQHA